MEKKYLMLLDELDAMVNQAYFQQEHSEENNMPVILCGICGTGQNRFSLARIK